MICNISHETSRRHIMRSVKADSHIACRVHAVPLPCRAAKVLQCVFPIWFTQCFRVWFTLAVPCHAHAMLRPCSSSQGHSTARPSSRGLEKNGMVREWHVRGMASVNQTRLHCVNQMGKTHSNPLAARHGRGTAWARHAMCESVFTGHCRTVVLSGKLAVCHPSAT